MDWTYERFLVDFYKIATPSVAISRLQIESKLVGVCVYTVFVFHQIWKCALYWNISTFVSSVQRSLFQRSCGFLICKVAKLSCAGVLFSERRLSTVSNKALFLFSHCLTIFYIFIISWYGVQLLLLMGLLLKTKPNQTLYNLLFAFWINFGMFETKIKICNDVETR